MCQASLSSSEWLVTLVETDGNLEAVIASQALRRQPISAIAHTAKQQQQLSRQEDFDSRCVLAVP
jgi:hypothetical protein